MSNPNSQAPSSPSWSVPLHRPPPGVVYDQSPQMQNQGYGNYPYSGGTGELATQAPSNAWGPDGNGPGQYDNTGPGPGPSAGQGGWYPSPEMSFPGQGGPPYSTYPPSGPSTSYTTQRRDTLPPTPSLGFGHGHGQSFARSNSLSVPQPSSQSQSLTPDHQDTKQSQSQSNKKKRKKGSPGSGSGPGPAGETEKEKEKRTKTGRACDACVSPSKQAGKRQRAPVS